MRPAPLGKRWRRLRKLGSEVGQFAWDTEPLTQELVKVRDEEIEWLIRHERRDWKLVNGRIANCWQPVAMAEGTYGGVGAYPQPGSIAMAAALSTTESAGILTANQSIYVPILGNATLAPQAWRFAIAGRYTVTTTPGSMITSFRLGNANTSPLLGTSGSVAFTASLTSAFILWKGDITIQSVGVPGANSKALGMFTVMVNTAVGGAYNSALWGTGSGTAVSFDSTLQSPGANGGALWLGLSDTGATNHATVTIDQVHWMDWN
jgi:hypothetical protein